MDGHEANGHHQGHDDDGDNDPTFSPCPPGWLSWLEFIFFLFLSYLLTFEIYSVLKLLWKSIEVMLFFFPHNSHKCSDASCFVFQSSGLYPAVIGGWIGTKILIGSCYLILSLAATFYIIMIIIFIITSKKNPMTALIVFCDVIKNINSIVNYPEIYIYPSISIYPLSGPLASSLVT